MEKVENKQEQMSNISRETETMRKKQMGILEIKNINRNECLWWAHQLTGHSWGRKKKISELKDQYKFLKLKAKEKKGKRTKYPRTVEQL